MATFLALDIGAESGRAVLGRLNRGHLVLEELHRFPNVPVWVLGHLRWNVLQLLAEVQKSLYLAGHNTRGLQGIGIDTWGVDFALLDEHGELLGLPYHYRDQRTQGMMTLAQTLVPRREIFAATGIQFLPINSLYQLLAATRENPQLLEQASTFLTIPDLLNYWLTSRQACEFTNATTTQCYNPRQKDWARELLSRLEIPTHFFPQIIPPGTALGPLHPAVATDAGLEPVPVIAPGCHDTASAVAAVPLEGDAAYLSSGTWSLLGAEVPEPVITDQSLAYNFTNEGGVAGRFRLLRNVLGLWLVQECRRAWERSGVGSWTYDQLTASAQEAPPLRSLVDPDHPAFLPPGDMPERIRTFCHDTRQPVPETPGAVVRCALESLALKYRWVLDRLEELIGRHLPTLHIVGGGSQNALLCQWTANASGRTVIAGPAEGTSVGNILVQAMATGIISSLEEARAVVRRSFDLVRYLPQDQDQWALAFERFQQLLPKGDTP